MFGNLILKQPSGSLKKMNNGTKGKVDIREIGQTLGGLNSHLMDEIVPYVNITSVYVQTPFQFNIT